MPKRPFFLKKKKKCYEDRFFEIKWYCHTLSLIQIEYYYITMLQSIKRHALELNHTRINDLLKFHFIGTPHFLLLHIALANIGK